MIGRAVRVGLVLAALALLVSMRQIDGVLGALHPPGAGSYRIGDLSGATSLAWDPGRPAKVIATWESARSVYGAGTSPRDVATWYVGLDGAFIVVYVALLAMMVRARRCRVREMAKNGPLVHAIAVGRATRRLREGSRPAEKEIEAEEKLEAKLLAVYDRLAVWTWVALGLAGAADVIEDVLQLALVRGSSTSESIYEALFVATVAKWLFVILVVAYIGVTALTTAQRFVGGRASRSDLRLLLRAAGVMRAQIVIVVAWVGGLFFAEQTPDVLRRWADASADGAARGAAATGVVTTLVLCLAVLVSGRLMLVQWRRAWDHPFPTAWALPVGMAIATAAILLVENQRGGLPLAVPAGIAFIVALSEWLLTTARAPEAYAGTAVCARDSDTVTPTFVELLAITPLVALALGLLHASVADVVFNGREGGILAGGIALLIVAAALWCVRVQLRHALDSEHQWIVLAVSCVLAAAVAVWIEVDHWPRAEWAGTIGVVAAFAIMVSGFAFLATWVAERVRPPRIVLVLRLRRIPVFTLLFIWALLGTRLADGTYHDVRTVERPHASITIDQAFTAWLTANRINPNVAGFTPTSDTDTRPLVLVAAEGGGIRAAYWTALAMDCMFGGGGGAQERMTSCPQDAGGPTSVFAASGASGGSVGLAAYMAHQFEAPDDPGWVRERLGGDYVSPTVAQGFFADLPDAFLGVHGFWDDRATVLERAWEQEWPRHEMSRLTPTRIWDRSAHRFPLLLLNGTSVADGCRLNASVLDAAVGPDPHGGRGQPTAPPDACSSLNPFEPHSRDEPPVVPGAGSDGWTLAGTKDLADFLCPGNDVRLSTAALLSARFPYVTPYGRLAPCARRTRPPTSYIVDGGYLDNTGATPLLQVWSKIEPLVHAYNEQPGAPCIVPLFVQIDNHYVAPVGPDEAARPSQLEAPALTVKSSRDGEEANARQAAALTFGRVVADADAQHLGWAHIYPQSHPGSQAPLGWTLSAGSMDDLEQQMRVQNGAALDVVKSWYDGQLMPAGPAGSGSSWCQSPA